MLNFLKPKPPLDDAAANWLMDSFNWCLENFDADYFHQHTVLVEPSNRFFPGKVESHQGMAELIFSRVKHYAGVSHWPTRVTDVNSCSIPAQPGITIQGKLRDANASGELSVPDDQRLLVPYNPQQISNPEGMIASFAHTLAHYLGQMAKTPPPGGAEFWPHVTELLAVYLGFGLMFANSAYTFRGGCGSCYNANANRDAFLTEQQSVYALAIFAVLKGLPDKSVSGHLKGHLKGFYRKAVRDIQRRAPEVGLLPAS